jgi:mono/diheme cytochrome c family protein
MRQKIWIAACFAFAALWWAAAVAVTPGVDRVAGAPIATVNGASVYAAYCADCHGALGRGDGRASAFLNPLVPDLTQVALRHPGADTLTLRALVEQGPAVNAADMPHWEAILNDTYQDRAKRLAILANLAEHLASMQPEIVAVGHPIAPRVRVVAIPVLESIDAHSVFSAYCADCHGAAGDGRGRFAAPLGIRPTDLTRVSHVYGEFDPAAEFYRLSHRHMVPDADFQGWEEILAHTYGPERARVMLSNLLAEIESMQASR